MRVMTLTAAMFLLFVLTVPAARPSALVRVPEPARSAIRLASITYHVDEGEMIRVAGCETGWTFDPRARNRWSGASGLFQFLSSTWARTPYSRLSVFDAHANALAAAWLYVRDGRSWREWTCRPN